MKENRIIDYYIYEAGKLRIVDKELYIAYCEQLYCRVTCYTKSARYVAKLACDCTCVTQELSDILSDIFVNCTLATGEENILRYRLSVM